MRTCRDITETIEKGSVKRLSISDKLSVRMHMRICKNCRHYARDSKILERMIRRMGSDSGPEFTTAEKKEMVRKLRGDQ